MDRNSIKTWRYRLYILAAISLVVRILLAWQLELGNDEVYYRLYGLYPDWSHFDHPLMIGMVMQIFSFNLALDSELFLRMSSIIFGTFNIFMVFKIGKNLRNSRTGFISALLYTSSIYAFVITGIFILPDTPQQFFWLLSLDLMIRTLPKCPNIINNGIKMMKIGLFIGLAIISKYTSVFLWLGVILYLAFFNREWFKRKWLYYAIVISFVISLPILIWNIQNDFISFTFHGNRVDVSGYTFNFDYFLTELLGELLYNNPINYILILISFYFLIRKKLNINHNQKAIVLFSSLPLVLLFIGFSMFRATLPHWTAPGITSLIFLAAAWLDQQFVEKSGNKYNPWPAKLSLITMIIVLVIGFAQIKYGIVNLNKNDDFYNLGENDPSLDMYGYRQLADEFKNVFDRDINTGLMDKNSVIAGNNWFPLANLDYYVADKYNIKTYAFGGLDKIHKFAWINKTINTPNLGSNAWYISDSRDFRTPDNFFKDYYNKIELSDTIDIKRGGKTAKHYFIYHLLELKKVPVNPLDNLK